MRIALEFAVVKVAEFAQAGRWQHPLARFEGISFRAPAAIRRWSKGGAPACATPPQRVRRSLLIISQTGQLAGSFHFLAGGVGRVADAGNAELELVAVGGSAQSLFQSDQPCV